MHPPDAVDKALALSAEGWNNCRIERATGIPRRTISGWVRGMAPKRGNSRLRGNCLACGDTAHPFPELAVYSYAYLLGLYLGDGTVSAGAKGVFSLRIFLDRRYQVLIDEAAAATSLVLPDNRTLVYPSRVASMDIVTCFSKHWPHLFPQHGPGLKHRREISLVGWQERIATRYPGRLLRGRVHSDGCRVQNIIRHPNKTYSYPRYFFSNRSLDIQKIFTDGCDLLGVRWRQDGPYDISVARREAVAILDRHIGPKR